MTDERWQLAYAIYEAAAPFAEPERSQYVHAAAPDAEIAVKVLAMLDEMEATADSVASRAPAYSEDPATASVPCMALSPGATIGSYQVLERLGSGGMGEVYLAYDPRLDRRVAIKLLPARLATDAVARERLRREALAAAALDHPFICKVFEIGEDQGTLFVVMEYISGETLYARLRAGPLPRSDALRIAAEVAEALQTAHAKPLVHRDLKPANVMLTSQGRAKVMDFGLAKRPASDEVKDIGATASDLPLTAAGAVTGTPEYMSPEQVTGAPLDPRSDLFSFGIVLCELLTGKHPFQRNSKLQTMTAILRDQPDLAVTGDAGLSPGHIVLIRRLLAKSPAERYQSMREVIDDLAGLATSSAATNGAAGRPQMVAAARWLLALAGVVAVLVGLNVANLRNRLLGRAGAPRIESLAVLPLANLSGDPQQEYFADGMTEALIADLGKISALRVISRTSVMQYKGAKQPLPEIARRLNVEGIIEGSVLRSGNRVRITAQLIQARAERHLWAESYERDLGDVLALQGEVAQAIAREVQTTLTPQEQARLAAAGLVNPEAYELYLKGRYEWNKRTKQGLNKGFEYFQQAINLDPNYAPAWSGVADSYGVMGSNNLVPGADVYPKAKAAALKAQEFDRNSAEAHASLALVLQEYDRDWSAAEREYRRAIQLNPSYATARHWYALSLALTGRDQEAIREIEQARRLDPLSIRTNANVVLVLYLGRHYDRAIAEARKALELEPNDASTHEYLGLTYLQKGTPEEALAELQKALSLERAESGVAGYLAGAYAVSGNREEALKILGQLKQQSKREYVSPYSIASAYVRLGDRDQALAWLQKGFDVYDGDMDNLKVDAALDPLRSDPRFHDLLRRMNFPP